MINIHLSNQLLCLFIGVVVSLVFNSCNRLPDTYDTISPNVAFSFTLTVNESSSPVYTIQYKGKEVIQPSLLGLEIDGNRVKEGLAVREVETKSVSGDWKPVYGERNQYPDNYAEALYELTGYEKPIRLRVRAYNEGVAFRYELPEVSAPLTVNSELTEFSVPVTSSLWASHRAQSEIMEMGVSEIEEIVERPLLIQPEENLFLAIGEAALVNFARMKLSKKAGGTLVASLEGEAVMNKSFSTPWRFVMAGETPGQILENNYLLLNLNEPNKLDDTSWIRPGKVIREVTLTTRGGMACVDFAVKHNLEYIEFDAGWYGNEYDDASDATTITVDPKRSKGPLDLLAVIEYAKSKDIGVILYVNRRALEKQLDEVLPLLSSWGVSGIKYGFVNVGPQEWTSWLHDAVRKAAEHKLMIDVHDEYRPTGYSRTYPNFMTQEGIRGDEESPTNSMVLKTLFTRMIAGAGDHTNCYFAPRVDETMGSHASQLAKSVIIYSPWQFLYWYDRPKGSRPGDEGAGGSKSFIQEVPELAFFDALPTVWDDTKVLEGYPGKYATVARKSGGDWFVGVLNGEESRTFGVPLQFLDQGDKYLATIYSDDASVATITKVKIKEQEVSAKDILKFDVKKSNGLAIHIRKVN
ncbi:MAG: glycoside hydrolase family 97 N-terminal domain-containing protein [Cyclobacteriaceae bacterium]|tara:strand:+ start:1686 stop:3593 length:1908 start_codon:yes stop_codon:yes gene_type:complete